eukprot:2364965-Amphidinium_carterae.1
MIWHLWWPLDVPIPNRMDPGGGKACEILLLLRVVHIDSTALVLAGGPLCSHRVSQDRIVISASTFRAGFDGWSHKSHSQYMLCFVIAAACKVEQSPAQAFGLDHSRLPAMDPFRPGGFAKATQSVLHLNHKLWLCSLND